MRNFRMLLHSGEGRDGYTIVVNLLMESASKYYLRTSAALHRGLAG